MKPLAPTKRIVLIGGGTGSFTLLSSLRSYPCSIGVIVSSADDGGSTGRLRTELGVMPMGDIRQCLVGLAKNDTALLRAFAYRFESGVLKGHVLGNILLAALEKTCGSIDGAITACKDILEVDGDVVSSAQTAVTLSATYEDGSVVVGEHAIDEPAGPKPKKIIALSLDPVPSPSPRALSFIADADLIVFGPGDLYTSIVPNLLVAGIADAVCTSAAKKVLISNLMTKRGQTDGFSASHFLATLEQFLGTGVIREMIINTERPSEEWLARYAGAHSSFVEPDAKLLEKRGVRVHTAELLSENIFSKSCADPLARSFLRHASLKTARIVWEILTPSSPA